MVSEGVALLVSHAVSLGNDGDDGHHLADAGHELEVTRLELMRADEVDACVIHVLELKLLQQNALSLIALVDVLLPNQGQDFTDIGIAVLKCHVVTIPVYKTHIYFAHHTIAAPLVCLYTEMGCGAQCCREAFVDLQTNIEKGDSAIGMLDKYSMKPSRLCA